MTSEGDIWIAFTNGNEPIKVTDLKEEVGYIEWTTDGKGLLFSTESGWRLLENPGSQQNIIKLLAEGKEIECYKWDIDISPDKSRFAYSTDEQIKVIPLDKSKKSTPPNKYCPIKITCMPSSINISTPANVM